ncbi:23S rRNA (adenine(1618)-N(6))-methyltransferase RlmF [Alteromonas sp. BL110]|uniref:23S rRNA (adenine(1618)-N(6))-methyltransferase RlmF n=1 Tax=Alteromonas sp. BL110 TaxID=1714845 RepID=UPI000E50B4C5|nr:23S rRNA (adenine(1618)-N(6))-methyltransferase RlmF [Alteromonas sp. BL110]AXT39598.1 23S rRNA (adenine(1618)-N(6))-methyltransferase RlmF [Alteromonas sp. BL110]RKM81915.1 23S rRNA (adenine(1618)-N(6))-methyltransferase RlmF [Alteromonas sp. BL110]
MHPKNLHKNGYPMDALCQSYPALKPFLVKAKSGNTSIDFTNSQAVKVLNAALLRHYYRLDYWDIPDGYLCPPVPGRADYIHGIADLLKSTGSSAQDGQRQNGKDQNIHGLDIGVGANAIYPIIGVTSYGWSFVGSDVDEAAVKNANVIASKNSVLADKLQVRKQTNSAHIFKGVIEESERFTFAMCNPPFHKSARDALSGTRRKTSNLTRNKQKRSGGKFTDNQVQGLGDRTSKLQGKSASYQRQDANLNFAGQANELWCEGGELAFIQRMVQESVSVKNNVEWFTCLVSKSAHLKPIKTSINYYGASQCKVVDMGQGSKLSRFIAWTF